MSNSYRKRAVVVEAFRLVIGADMPDWFDAAIQDGRITHPDEDPPINDWGRQGLDVQTPNGKVHASTGDWIIKGVAGELYPCKPEVFERTYSSVDTEKD